MLKKRVIAVCLLVAFGTANAQIPVTDGVHIATTVFNEVETIAQWANQYTQMANQIQQYEQQIEQYKQHYQAVTGSRGMGQLLTNTASLTTSLPADWQNTISSIKNTASYATARAKYPTFTNKPKANNLYDVVATHDATTSDLYTKANSQISDIKSLMGQIDSASDPAAKQDLMNRLVSQQNALQANQNLVTLVNQKQKQDLEVASRSAASEAACSEFKRSC
jgi:type IV secretion system protein VirB5